MRTKPSLTLIPGEDALDLNSLMELYTRLTGKEPTPEELEEAKGMLEEVEAEDATKPKP